MSVLMLAVDLWAGPLALSQPDISSGVYGYDLTWRSDNMAVVTTINSGKARDDFLATGLRYVMSQLAIRDARLTLTYVNSKENCIADGLSRGCLETVNKLESQGFIQKSVVDSRLTWVYILDNDCSGGGGEKK